MRVVIIVLGTGVVGVVGVIIDRLGQVCQVGVMGIGVSYWVYGYF